MEAGRLVKLLISICFYAVSGSWNAIPRLWGRRAPGTAVVLYYHHVMEEHCERFARQMEYLLRWAELIRADHSSPLRPGTRYAAVTFDDGCLSMLENALPELERLKIPATVFVIVDYLGKTPECDPTERCITAQELQSLTSDLFTIGSHTSTHPLLTALKERDAWMELRESREKLQRILNREVKLFCFPFGAYNQELVEWCREAGYERVFTGLQYLAFSDPREFVTGRTSVEPTDWPLEFHLKLVGAYRWVPFASRLKQRILSNPFARIASARFGRLPSGPSV